MKIKLHKIILTFHRLKTIITKISNNPQLIARINLSLILSKDSKDQTIKHITQIIPIIQVIHKVLISNKIYQK